VIYEVRKKQVMLDSDFSQTLWSRNQKN